MSDIITRVLTREEQFSLMGYVNYSARTKLRKVRFKKYSFMKKTFTLQKNVLDFKNHNTFDSLDVFTRHIKC